MFRPAMELMLVIVSAPFVQTALSACKKGAIAISDRFLGVATRRILLRFSLRWHKRKIRVLVG